MLDHFLMRKNDIVAVVEFNQKGQMIKFLRSSINKEIAPLSYRYRDTWLMDWWEDRSVPISQARIKELLNRSGYISTSEYLIKNLGLSLTDYYWVKPVDSDLKWEHVSLFSNDFKENILFEKKIISDEKVADGKYSPHSTLQGDIEKTWAIINGKRCLVKGNRNNLSGESINEIIATKIHELQGYNNYAKYALIVIKDRDYDFGCYTETFTSEDTEFLPAWTVYSSEQKNNNISLFDHYMNMCKKYGMDKELLQHEIDYQIMTDFIISEYDRHLNNFGLLRDADSLRMISAAPIFDSGGALFVNKEKPKDIDSLLAVKTNGFNSTERTLIKNVSDKNCIDLTKLPDVSFLKEMYGLDSQMHEEDINLIAYAYEKKIDICRDIQLNRDPWRKKYSVNTLNN